MLKCATVNSFFPKLIRCFRLLFILKINILSSFAGEILVKMANFKDFIKKHVCKTKVAPKFCFKNTLVLVLLLVKTVGVLMLHLELWMIGEDD